MSGKKVNDKPMPKPASSGSNRPAPDGRRVLDESGRSRPGVANDSADYSRRGSETVNFSPPPPTPPRPKK